MGRKKTDDPKISINVYVKESVVELNGGKEKTKEKAIKFLEESAKEAARKKNIENPKKE